MKKYIMPTVLALIIGLLFSKFLIGNYDKKESISTVFKNSETLFFLNVGTYSNLEEMEKSMSDFPYYIYNIENDKYQTYIGITSSLENSEKLKGFYQNLGYNTSIREINISNEAFIEVLKQYDKLLIETNDEKTIKAICNQVLSKYEELILNDSDD